MLHSISQPGGFWQMPILPTALILLTGAIYVRGWVRAHVTRPAELPSWRLYSFLSGLAVLFVAIASPIDGYADDLLLMHMTQHILLMSVVPPLIALGAPVVPLLRGVPKYIARAVVGPVLRMPLPHRIARFISRPVPALTVMVVTFIAWHLPAAYDEALRLPALHELEHFCFLATSMIFWWKIIQPWPTRFAWSPWTKLACLVGADVANTAVSAYLSFCGHVVYASYAHGSRIFAISPLSDQNGAGAEMWVMNSLVFLIPAMIIPMRALAPSFQSASAELAKNRLAQTGL